MKITERRNQAVTSIHLEVMTAVNERLEAYCHKFGWSKRKIMEDALVCWLNQRDMEAEQRNVKVGV